MSAAGTRTVAAGVEAVVFDWDGTLVDSRQALIDTYQQATAAVLGTAFPTAPADIDRIIQMRGPESFAEIARGDAAIVRRLAAAFHEAYVANQASSRPFPGTLETLRALRSAGRRIGVATSKARVRLELEQARTGIGPFLDAAVSGDDVSRAKPDPEAITRAVAELGAAAARTLYVGDGPNDIIAGRAAGAITVGVSFGFHPAEMRAAEPEFVIDDLRELLALVPV